MLALLLVLTSSTSAGIVTATGPSADACADSANEAGLLACRRHALRDQDARIAALDARLAERAADEPKLVKALNAARASWQAYRVAECTAVTWESAQGTAAETYRLSCLVTLGAARLAALQDRVDNP